MELLIVVLLVAAGAFGYWKLRQYNKARAVARYKEQLAALLPEQFVVFDLETTGLDPMKHEIIEIGAIKANRDSDTHQTYAAFVKPNRKVPKKITEITGITQEMIDAEGEPLESALREFRDFIGDCHLVAYNSDFDMSFLKAAADASGLEFHNNVACALKMARQAWPGRRSYRLKDLASDGSLDTSDSHRALGDCKRTLTIYTAAVTVLGRIR